MNQIPSFPEDMNCLQECTICMEVTSDPPFKYCTCKCVICEPCLTKWNRTSYPQLLCPICRRQYGSWDDQPPAQFIFIVHRQAAPQTTTTTPFTQRPTCQRILCFSVGLLLGMAFFFAIVYELVRKT